MIIKREVITSRNNSCVKWASSLSDKKAREEHRVFIAEGEKLSFEAMEAKLPITHVYILESKIEKLLPRVTKDIASRRDANVKSELGDKLNDVAITLHDGRGERSYKESASLLVTLFENIRTVE